jgi:hypothetical protein
MILLPSSVSRIKPDKQSAWRKQQIMLFYPDEVGSAFFLKVCKLLPDYTASYP